MDNDNSQGGANGAPPAGNPPADAGKPAAGVEPAAPSHRDWNALASNIRELTSSFKQVAESLGKGAVTASAPAPKDEPKPANAPASSSGNNEAMARVAELERNLALRDAFLEHGITDPEIRGLISDAAKANGSTDVGSFVAKYAAKLKPPAAAPAAAPAATPAPAVSSGTAGTGIGGAPARVQQPNNVLAIDPAAWSAMSPEEKRAAHQRQMRGNGNHNPFAEGKLRKK